MKWLYGTDDIGATEILHEDSEGWTYERKMDVQPIADEARDARNLVSDYGPSRWKGRTHRVATVPIVVIEKLISKRGMAWFKDNDAIKRFLNDPDNSVFRTKPGKI